MVRRRSSKAVIRPLDPSDPRNLDHPSHKEQWLALARALGRLDARRDFEALRKGERIGQTSARKTKPGP
jgi:hypothetical protein